MSLCDTAWKKQVFFRTKEAIKQSYTIITIINRNEVLTMDVKSQIQIMDNNDLNKHLDDEDKALLEDLSDDDVIQKAFDELNNEELLDVLSDFADKIYDDGTIKERGLLAEYMQNGLEIREGI